MYVLIMCVMCVTCTCGWLLPAVLQIQRESSLSNGHIHTYSYTHPIFKKNKKRRKPRVLLLDEPTSALDAQSEGLVQRALDQGTSWACVYVHVCMWRGREEGFDR